MCAFFFFYFSQTRLSNDLSHRLNRAPWGKGGEITPDRIIGEWKFVGCAHVRTCVPRKNHRAVIAKCNYRLDANILENQVNPTLVDRLNVDFKRTV